MTFETPAWYIVWRFHWDSYRSLCLTDSLLFSPFCLSHSLGISYSLTCSLFPWITRDSVGPPPRSMVGIEDLVSFFFRPYFPPTKSFAPPFFLLIPCPPLTKLFSILLTNIHVPFRKLRRECTWFSFFLPPLSLKPFSPTFILHSFGSETPPVQFPSAFSICFPPPNSFWSVFIHRVLVLFPLSWCFSL